MHTLSASKLEAKEKKTKMQISFLWRWLIRMQILTAAYPLHSRSWNLIAEIPCSIQAQIRTHYNLKHWSGEWGRKVNRLVKTWIQSVALYFLVNTAAALTYLKKLNLNNHKTHEKSTVLDRTLLHPYQYILVAGFGMAILGRLVQRVRPEILSTAMVRNLRSDLLTILINKPVKVTNPMKWLKT